MNKPKLLDLFCCAGGASKGYADAGFEVVGVDLDPQPRYPFEFHQGDALEFLAEYANRFDVFAASPPCRDHTRLVGSGIGLAGSGWLLDATRDAFSELDRPWVIENVVGAPLRNPITLCGCMFALGADGYRLQRRRQFESNIELPQPACTCRMDDRPVVGVYGGKVRNRVKMGERTRVGTTLPLDLGRRAMGVDWANVHELGQAIPPAYTEWVGKHLLA